MRIQTIFFLMLAVVMSAPSWAQSAPRPSLEVALTYDATHTSQAAGGGFWMQGGSLQVEGRFYRGLGLVAQAQGSHVAGMSAGRASLDLVTTIFGPRYTWQMPHRRFAVFGQGLLGEANGFNSVFPNINGADSSNYSLALQIGGGMNYTLSHHLAVRAIEANWLRTQLPNSTTNVQNNLRLGTGLIYRFR